MWPQGFIYSRETAWTQGFIFDGFNGRCIGDLDMIGKEGNRRKILLNSILNKYHKQEE
jgi:hypothetical protein